MIGQGQQSCCQRAVQGASHFVDGVPAIRVKVGPPDIADKQRVPGEYEPWLTTAGVIGYQVRVM